MSNFEDDEALFDDIYSGDQPAKVDSAPSTNVQETPAEQTTSTTTTNTNDSTATTDNNNSNETATNEIPENESTEQAAVEPYNAESQVDAQQVPTPSAVPNAQQQVPAEYYQQMQQIQQLQMMQQQQQQQMPMQMMPGMPMVPGMQGMPQQYSQMQQYQQFQQQQQQQQPQQQSQTPEPAEHIPDITEIEVPTGYTDTVKADLANKDVGKLFIGGLNWETDEDRLKSYFSKYGDVLEINVMRDGATGKSRGFAFLTFATGESVDAVLREKHILDGKLIDPKRAIPKDEQEKVGKVFVGGIAADVTPEEFRNYFEKFGSIIDSQLMINKDTGKSRGYGFVTYDSAEAVERVTRNNYVMFHGKKMEIKKAEPRTQHMKNIQAKSNDSRQGGNNGGYNNMNNNMGGNGGYGMMNGYNDMSQYWQQMQQMQQMQQYWMMQQQQQQQQQMQHMSPSSQEAQINMYANDNSNGNGNNNDDDDVPNPQERGGQRGGYDDYDDQGDKPNLPSGPKKFRDKNVDERPPRRENNNGGGSRYNERRNGGGGGGRRGGKYRGGNKRGGNYHPYRR